MLGGRSILLHLIFHDYIEHILLTVIESAPEFPTTTTITATTLSNMTSESSEVIPRIAVEVTSSQKTSGDLLKVSTMGM